MNRYLEQLIEDMDLAVSNQIAIRSHLDILGEGEVCETEQESPSDAKTFPLSRIIGFEKCYFPPEEKLTDDQVKVVYTHLLCVLDNYNFFLDFPDKVDIRAKYIMLLEALDEDTTYSNAKVTIIEFCDYDYDTCPFGIELCQCKRYEDMS
jgi:hypothetical protein